MKLQKIAAGARAFSLPPFYKGPGIEVVLNYGDSHIKRTHPTGLTF